MNKQYFFTYAISFSILQNRQQKKKPNLELDNTSLYFIENRNKNNEYFFFEKTSSIQSYPTAFIFRFFF